MWPILLRPKLLLFFLDGLGVSILDPPEMAGNMPEIYRNFNLNLIT